MIKALFAWIIDYIRTPQGPAKVPPNPAPEVKPTPIPAPKPSPSPTIPAPPASTAKKGQRLKRIPFAKQCSFKLKTKGAYPNGIQGAIVHWTAGHDGAENVLKYAITQGYTFLCIQKDGKVAQAHDLDQWGYHAGESWWKVLGSSVSSKTLGIEINNAGKLTPTSDGRYKSWFNTYYTKDQVRYSSGEANICAGYYEKFTPAQEKTLVEVLFFMKDQYPEFSFDYVLGHDEIAGPTGLGKAVSKWAGKWRKTDPGASLSMTMPKFREYLKAEYAKRSK